MTTAASHFALNPNIEANSHWLITIDDIQIRLNDDARWPWLVLVPEIANVQDVDDMTAAQNQSVMELARQLSATMKALFPGTSTNVATLANRVTQFHLHVVCRCDGDPNWPDPVWGFGEAQPYAPAELLDFQTRFAAAWMARHGDASNA